MKKWYFLSPLILQKLIWIPTRLIFFTFGHFKIYGLENLRDIETNVIFAANHSSEMDVFPIPAALPFFSRFSPIFYTSRERAFYINAGWRKHFYGGALFKSWGAYPVYVGLHDYDKSLVNHVRILRDGGSLCIFPEGRTTKDGNIQPAKGGVAYLSYTTGRPIVPVKISGTFRITFMGFMLGKSRLSIAFGQPMYFDPKGGAIQSFEDFKIHANMVMDKIRSMPQEV